MLNADVIITEPIDDKLIIKTKTLFNSYDKGKGIIFHTSEGDVYIKPLSFHYKSLHILSYLYESLDEYENAVFGFDYENRGIQLLSEWDLKLLQLFHVEWFNELRLFLNSGIFVNILKTLNNLRSTNIVTPEKPDVFLPFKTPILETTIPQSLTSCGNDNHAELWKPFITITNQIYLNYESQRSKGTL